MKKEGKITKNLTPQQKLMIWKTKMSEKGFTKEEYKEFEKDVFNGYISEDIAETLQKTKIIQDETITISKQIKKDSKKASVYFLLTIIVAIVVMVYQSFSS